MAAARIPLQIRPGDEEFGTRYVWELPVRLTHWVTAAAIVVLFSTGLFISWPVFASHGEPYQQFLMGRFREVHFVAAYALLFSFLVRSYWFIAGNQYARSGMPEFWDPLWRKEFVEQVHEYLGKRRGVGHLGHNALAGLSYVGLVGGLGIAQIVTGFAMYGESNPGGFWDRLFGWVIPLMGGSFRTHMWHHLFAWGFVVFVMLHLYILVFGSIRYRNGLISSIISGDKFFRPGDHEL